MTRIRVAFANALGWLLGHILPGPLVSLEFLEGTSRMTKDGMKRRCAVVRIEHLGRKQTLELFEHDTIGFSFDGAKITPDGVRVTP